MRYELDMRKQGDSYPEVPHSRFLDIHAVCGQKQNNNIKARKKEEKNCPTTMKPQRRAKVAKAAAVSLDSPQ